MLLVKLPLVAGVPLVSFVIPEWGATGAVIAIGCVRLCSAALLLRVGVRDLSFQFPGLYAAKVLAASLGAVSVTIGLQGALSPG